MLLHATVWGVFTALLRPVVGEGCWEFLGRGGNYGMSLAMLILVGGGGWSLRRWFTRGDLPTAVSDRAHVGVHSWSGSSKSWRSRTTGSRRPTGT